MNAKCFLVLAAALALAGCATTTPPPLTTSKSPDLVSSLTDGKTTKEQAILRLGQPSGRFEAGKILTYRLGYESTNHDYIVRERQPGAYGWPTWYVTQFSMVLVFDDNGVLQKHSLVKVNR